MPSVSTLQVPLPDDASPGLYIHIPFCRYVCPYCDFNVYAGQSDLIPDYLTALAGEMELLAELHRPAQGVPTVFIGGGTPSLLDPAQVAQIIEAADSSLGVATSAEITLESNPDNLDLDYCRGLLEAGINRLSIGVQSLQQPGLKVLGRLHGAAGAERAYAAARKAGFDNLSLDFIYGWPGQTRAQLRADLQALIDWDVEHVSLYALIVEQGTPLSTAVRRGQLLPVDDDTVASYYDEIVERLAATSFEHYEISNWARSPRLRSVHNQIYWQNGRYFGVGAGAHAYLGNVRSSNVKLPARYIETIRSGALPVAMEEAIDARLAIGETMMLGLRLLQDGVSEHDFQVRHGVALTAQFGELIERYVEMSLLAFDDGRLCLTPSGAMVSNSILAGFLP